MSTLWNSFNVVRLARVSNSAGTETDGPGSNLYHRTVSYEGGCGWWVLTTDYGRPVRKLPSLHGRKSNPNPNFIGKAEAYFVCRIGQNIQISLFIPSLGVRSAWFWLNVYSEKTNVCILQSVSSDGGLLKVSLNQFAPIFSQLDYYIAQKIVFKLLRS